MRRPRYDPLDLGDIQGNILRGYGFEHSWYLFVKVNEAAAGRIWLGELVDPVTTAEEWVDGKPETALNVALTYAGLAAVGVPDHLLTTFSPEFREGMVARADLLGDHGASEAAGWDDGLRDDGGHVLVIVNARTEGALSDRMTELTTTVGGLAPRLEVVHQQRAEMSAVGREHFGFSDGFGQPAVCYGGMDVVPGQGTPVGRQRWQPLKPGEFVLGYEDEDGVLPEAPAQPLGDNGTYMVYRKLEQDVVLFRSFMAQAGAAYPGGPERLAAKVVGRWRDGTPLVLAPDGPDPVISGSKERINDFRYRDDPTGHLCPLGAHIRRANPRDAMVGGGRRTGRHRIIRRGMPYGPPLPEGLGADGAERGLLFVCFNASIRRQFETIQAQWCSDGNVFGLAGDRDFLLGGPGGQGKMTIPGTSPFFVSPPQPFVRTRGGAYLFVPGLDALRALARGWPAP